MRRVCLVPSEPVIPLTRMRELSSRKIAIDCSFRPSGSRRGQLGHPAGSTVHRVDELHTLERGVEQDAPPGIGVVAVQAYDQWLVDRLALFAQQGESGD